MPEQRGAGKFIELVAFDKRAPADDGYGNTVAAWVEQFRQHAAFVAVRGSEPVDAAKPASRQATIITVRVSAQAKLIAADWQCRDVRRGTVFNIRTITDDNSRAEIDLLVESGVAPG